MEVWAYRAGVPVVLYMGIQGAGHCFDYSRVQMKIQWANNYNNKQFFSQVVKKNELHPYSSQSGRLAWSDGRDVVCASSRVGQDAVSFEERVGFPFGTNLEYTQARKRAKINHEISNKIHLVIKSVEYKYTHLFPKTYKQAAVPCNGFVLFHLILNQWLFLSNTFIFFPKSHEQATIPNAVF